MTFVKYQNTNNASSVLIADISAQSTTLLITDGDQDLFPSEFPYLLTIEKSDSEGNVNAREIVKVLSKNQNTLVVERGAGTCVQDDTATNRVQGSVSHSFSAGDSISLYRTAEQVEDIQNNIENIEENYSKSSSIANEYDNTATYSEGDVVMYLGERYKCNTEISTAEEFTVDHWDLIPVQTELKQAQDDIVTLQNSKYASDHLEEKGIVGERYTLSNELFKQYTPTLANSTLNCNVGDVASNVSIHIQRIGSGTASNQLKLKIKSVGSPTTGLVVEVRKGVQVNVSTTEAYWYGNEIVASGSIAYSNITNSYSEFTVTLNNEFGGTEGELLDVVVYQTGSIVNASNYYVIGCDNSQYSEAFSYVAVNGLTRTRSKLMPYCLSDGFAQSLLCKVGASNIVCNTETFTLSEDRYSTNLDYTTVFTYTFQGTGALAINADSYKRQNSNEHSGHEGARILVDNVVVSESTGYDTVAKTHIVNMALTTSGTHTIIFQCKGYPASWTSSGGWKQGGTVNFTHTLYPNNKNYGKPTEIKQIGTESGFTIFGMINGDFFKNDAFDQYLTISGTTQTATTGSITLGNAVGFLEINYNGQIVKVPFYS